MFKAVDVVVQEVGLLLLCGVVVDEDAGVLFVYDHGSIY